MFAELAPMLANRTVMMTVCANGQGMLTLSVIPKKVIEDESDVLTTALCITATPEELDRTLPSQLRDYTAAHATAATNLQKVKDLLAAAEKAERAAAEERRAKKGKLKTPAPTPEAPPQGSLGMFDEDGDSNNHYHQEDGQ